MDEFWNLRTLYNFMITADRENMTTAAGELFLTQPALSHQIHKIETDLNLTLFYRENKGLKLTDQGRAFYQECRQLLEAHERFNSAVFRLNRAAVGSLKIGYSKASERYMMQVNHRFVQKYPDIQIRGIRQSVSKMLDLVEERKLDAAYVHGEDLENANAVIRSFYLFSLDYMLLTSTDNPLARRESVDFSELGDQYFVLPMRTIHPEKVDTFMRYCRECGFVPNIRNYYHKLSDYLMEIATYPETVSILPYIHSMEEEKKDLVKFVPLTGYKPKDDIYFAWNDNSPASSLQLYISALRAFKKENSTDGQGKCS